ncbi:MAG TPA: hypothetical protein VGN83_12590 [Falsiroseomonas sp.]|nr:hypothetical protein [Falsiroseomonas sp.]
MSALARNDISALSSAESRWRAPLLHLRAALAVLRRWASARRRYHPERRYMRG